MHFFINVFRCVCGFFFCIFCLAFGQNEEVQENKKNNSLNDLSSVEIRRHLTWGAAYHMGYDYRANTQQLSLSYYLDERRQLSLRAGYADSDYYDGNNRILQTTVATEMKFFLGNSFYVAPEIFYINYRGSWFLGLWGRRYTGLGLGARIGNQWHYDRNLLFGIDWFGHGRGVHHFTSKARVAASDPEFDESNLYVYTVLNIYLGISF